MPQELSYGESDLLKTQYKIKKQIDLDNFTIETRYPTWAENIKINFDLELSPISPWDFGKSQTFTTEKLLGTVQVEKVRTEFTERQQSGGSLITFDFKAECRDLILHLKDKNAKLKGALTVHNLGNKIKLQLDQSQVHWSKESWTIDSLNCTGANGFGRIMERKLDIAFKSPKNLQKQIQEKLALEVQALEDEINQTIFKKHKIHESAKNFLALLEPQNLHRSPESPDFKFKGKLRLRYRGISIKKKTTEEISFKTPPPKSPHQMHDR